MQSRIKIVTLLVLLLHGTTQSQPLINQPDTFKLQNIGESSLGKYVSIYIDSLNDKAVSEIVFLKKAEFTNNHKDEIKINFSESNHWLRFIIKNEYNYLLTSILEIKNPSINKIQLFIEQDGFVKAFQETGDSYSFYTRNTDNRNFIFEITLDPGSVNTYYIKINTEGNTANFPITIYSPSEFTKKISREHIINGIFYGIMIAIIFTSFFLLLLNFRKPAHFFYIIYVTLTGFFVLNIDGLSFQYLWPDSPWMANNMNNILSLLSTFFLIEFAIAYFDLKHQKRTYYNIARVLAYTNLVLIPFALTESIPAKITSFTIAYLMIISILIVTIISIILYKKGPQLTIFFLLAFFSFLFSTIIISSNIYSGFLNISQREMIFKIGLAFQVTLLSVALSVRLKILQEVAHKTSVDNLMKLNKFKEESNRKLEEKVKERTETLEKTNDKFLNAIIEIGNKNTRLHQQRIEILKQKDEITQKNLAIEKSLTEIRKKNDELALRNNEIRLQRDQIINQKNLLQNKNQDITDSINYAKRIQNSILPGDDYINKLLPESFIFFRPKDILSGDFYWIDQYPPEKHELFLESKKKKKIIVALVDCTGHGIPGALMSVIGKDQLDRAIFQYGLTKPSVILETLNQGVNKIMSYNTENNTIHDGMDISLISFDPEKNKLEFAGANQNLYLVRNKEIQIFNGNRTTIGEHHYENNFKNQVIDLHSGDTVYMFSDGYIDQFGGPENKKYKSKQFKELLLNLNNFPMHMQKEKLLQEHLHWKNDQDQVDDILIIGIKF